MALIFGGKLLAPKQKRQANNEQNNLENTNGIQFLSQREQELLDELQKTRSNIVKELIRISPEVRKEEIGTWRNTIKQYQSNLNQNLSSSIKNGERPLTSAIDKRRHHKRQLELQSSKNLQSLPILSSSGEFTFSFKTKREDPIVLPVLTFPTLRTTSSQNSNVQRIEQQSSSMISNNNNKNDISQISNETNNILLNCDQHDVNFMINYFSLSKNQWSEIVDNFDKLSRYISVSNDELMMPTVFASVNTRSNELIPSLDDSTNFSTGLRGNFASSPSLPPIHHDDSRNSTMRPLLRGTSLSTFHTTDVSTTTTTKLKARNSGNTNSKSVDHGKPKKRHNSLHQYQKERSPSIQLRQELIASLGNMQQYTAEVKQSILNVQDIVALTNPRARAFVISMAADQMCGIITRIGRRELKRGLDAWKLSVKLDVLKYHTIHLKRFLLLRCVALKLNQLVISVLRFNFLEWVKYCVAERLRAEMEMKSAAAVTIQRVVRGNIGRAKARKAAEGNKFAILHRSLVKLQAIFRGKLRRWKYLKYRRDILEETSCELIQKVVRGFLGRRRAQRIRSYQSKISAAITIQAAARGRKGRIIAASLRLLRLKNKVIVKIQALARGYIGRMRVSTILREKAQYAAAVKIQARIRGVVTRMNLHHRRREMEEYRLERNRYAVKIQAAYRGFRARVMFRYYMEEHNQEVMMKNKSATKIQSRIRIFLALRKVSKLQQDRLDRWIIDASTWKEIWSEDSGAWFYLNSTTEEALWEPPPVGYTKSDGQLVLKNGKIIDPPDTTGKKKRMAGQEHLCVECVKRIAIRRCVECGDNFCTKCYKETHSSGSRKQHTFEAIGPIECTECEEELAERWCISCDEPYCDSCWRKVHSKGKRRYHPFSQVQEDGHIDARIFTIDGEQVHNYDASYSQNRFEEEGLQAATTVNESMWAQEDYYPQQQQQQDDYSSLEQYEGGELSEWTSYYDENNVVYWYNTATGESTYEDPTNVY